MSWEKSMFKVVGKVTIAVEKASAAEDILGTLYWSNGTTFSENLSHSKDKCVKH